MELNNYDTQYIYTKNRPMCSSDIGAIFRYDMINGIKYQWPLLLGKLTRD